MNTVADRIASIILHLCTALGAFGRRIATPPQPVWLGTKCFIPIVEPDRLPPLPIPAWNLFIARIQKSARRIQALYAQWQAGTLKPPRISVGRAKARHPHPKPELRLPRAFGWANHRAREVIPVAGLLHGLLQEPHSQPFLTEVPRAARLLRPICQALGVEQPTWLKLPPRPRKPRRKRPGHACPLPLTDPSLGLQPYVIAAVRFVRRGTSKKSGNPG